MYAANYKRLEYRFQRTSLQSYQRHTQDLLLFESKRISVVVEEIQILDYRNGHTLSFSR